MRSFVLCLSLSLVAAACSPERDPAPPAPFWRLVYQHDQNGNPLTGSVEDLVNAMKRGSPIRVSWGGTVSADSSWIEFAEPVFTTVMNDNAVVVQFPLSFIQTDYVEPDAAFLDTDPPTGWRALMSTNGNYHQFHYDLRTGEVSRIMFARTQASWFALVPAPDERAIPELTPSDAFELDSVIRP
ncbi:MAG: hypothetical protein ACREMK_12300 [Gemmatimonadota bacterium]